MTVQVDKAGPILVTGSEGFIGRALVGSLLAEGRTVVALDLATCGDRVEHAGSGKLIPVQASIADFDVLMAAARDTGVQAIVNLAALIIPACRENPVLGAEVNIIGHINVFEVARQLGIQRLVYTSTIAALPRPPHGSPVNLYGVYKRCCEEIAKVYHIDYGMGSIGLRPNVVYGPGREIGETAFASQAISAVVRGESYVMPFCGAMCFQHVDEVVDVITRCLARAPTEPLVSDITTEVRSVDDLIAAIRLAVPSADLVGSDRMRSAPKGLDDRPLRALLGAWPSISLEEGARRTVAALRRTLHDA